MMQALYDNKITILNRTTSNIKNERKTNPYKS